MTNEQRINPLFEASETTENTKETAGYNSLESVERCPICNKPMEVLSCNGIPAHVCRVHRIALPTRDE